MADLPVKMRLKSGLREIDVEGRAEDVDKLLAKWWDKLTNSAPAHGEPASADVNSSETVARNESTATKRSKPPSRKARKSQPQSDSPERSGNGIDIGAAVNSIKQDDRFPTFEEKIILTEGDPFNKAAFAIWHTKSSLTTGEIHKILTRLNIRIGLPAISKIVKENINRFITDGVRKRGGQPVRYSLSARAEREFEFWMRQ